MRIAPDRLDRDGSHDLLKQVIVPRPIAWITTLRDNGLVNLAPFSCYTFVGIEPMMICLSFERAPGGRKKDTLANIERTGQLVVHPVTEDMVELANSTARPAPADESKLSSAGLTAAPSERVETPRIAESSVAFECESRFVRSISKANEMVVAEVVSVFVDDYVLTANRILDPARYRPVGRMDGDKYVRLGDVFELPRD